MMRIKKRKSDSWKQIGSIVMSLINEPDETGVEGYIHKVNILFMAHKNNLHIRDLESIINFTDYVTGTFVCMK